MTTDWIKQDTPAFTGLTRIVYIMDRSGSMGGREKEVIDGFNGWKKEVLATPGDTDFTLVLFDDVIEMPIKNVPLAFVHDLDETKYFVRGTTALLDAIGQSIGMIRSQVRSDDRVLFIIITDGFENASKEYRGAEGAKRIKKQIEDLEAKGNWTFTYLSSDINGLADAQNFGFKRGNTMVVGEMGPEVYRTLSQSTISYRGATGQSMSSFYGAEAEDEYNNQEPETVNQKINVRVKKGTNFQQQIDKINKVAGS